MINGTVETIAIAVAAFSGILSLIGTVFIAAGSQESAY